MADQENLFCALRAAFPADLDGTAIETADGPTAPLRYSWRDLECASAMLANLLDSLELPPGISVKLAGDAEIQADSFRNLGLAMLLAIVRRRPD